MLYLGHSTLSTSSLWSLIELLDLTSVSHDFWRQREPQTLSRFRMDINSLAKYPTSEDLHWCLYYCMSCQTHRFKGCSVGVCTAKIWKEKKSLQNRPSRVKTAVVLKIGLDLKTSFCLPQSGWTRYWPVEAQSALCWHRKVLRQSSKLCLVLFFTKRYNTLRKRVVKLTKDLKTFSVSSY